MDQKTTFRHLKCTTRRCHCYTLY